MAFMRVSNNKKHTHCICISHSITVFVELHTIHKRLQCQVVLLYLGIFVSIEFTPLTSVYFAYFTPVWMWFILSTYMRLPLCTLSTSTYLGVPHLHAFNRYLPVFTSFTPLHAFTCSTTLPLFTYMGHTGVHLCCACI